MSRRFSPQQFNPRLWAGRYLASKALWLGVAVLHLLGRPAWAQDVDLEAENQMGMSHVNPVRPTYPDSAYVLEPGFLQFEAGYEANIFEESEPLQTLGVLGAVGVMDLFEARLMFDVLNVQGDDAGIGDLGVGAKAGFFGGLDEDTSLAAIFEVTFPTAPDPFGLDNGVGAMAGVVASRVMQTVQLDLQAALDTHLFADHPGISLPLSLGMTWEAVNRFLVLADVVERVDLTNFSDSQTSLMAGVGYRFIPELQVDGTFRLGLSQDMPDMGVGFGVTWLSPQVW